MNAIVSYIMKNYSPRRLSIHFLALFMFLFIILEVLMTCLMFATVAGLVAGNIKQFISL